MQGSHEYKRLMVLTTGMRWFYGIMLIMVSLLSLSHIHLIVSNARDVMQTYEIGCCNPFRVVCLSLVQLIIGLMLLVPKTARWGAYLGIVFFMYVIVSLWMKGSTNAIGINAFLVLGLVIIIQLLRFHHTVQPVHE